MSHSIRSVIAHATGHSSEGVQLLPGEELLTEGVLGSDLLAPLRELQNELLQEGQGIVNLSMVNPDLSPPRQVLDRLLESVTKMNTHRYAVSRGIRRLREAFAHKYSQRFEIPLNPETQVCVCLGSKDGTFHALRALVRPGDAVVVGTPSYPAHLAALQVAGARKIEWQAVADPATAADRLAKLIASSGAKVVLLNLPSNPTGLVVSEEWWRAIGGVCSRTGVVVINDFVYGEMCFSGKPATSALVLAKEGVSCVEVYSLSKSHNIPGWRVGALVGDARIVKVVARLKSHADYGLFLPLQHAAAFALTSPDDLVGATVATYERRIKVLSLGLQRLGWEVAEAQAGACVWAKFPAVLSQLPTMGGRSVSVGVAHALLKKYGVLVTPGVVFGESFDDYVRFAAVVSEEKIRDVLSALAGLRAVSSLP